MALTISLPHVDRPEPASKALVADRRLYLAADEQTVVERGHPGARFLLAAAGMPIPGHEAARLQLAVVEGRIVQQRPAAGSTAGSTAAEAKQSAPDDDKQAAPDADKQARPDADKQASPQGDKSDKSKREKK